MPTIVDRTHWFQLNLGDDPDRSTGTLHLSQIVRSLAIRLGKLKADEPMEERNEAGRFPAGAAHTLRVMAGLAWEQWLAAAHPQLEFHAGEVQRGGIVGSPDAFSNIEGTLVVHEFKFSWKSSRKPIDEQWMWMRQIMAYCYMMRTRVGCMHVYYVNSDYYVKEPKYLVWHIVWTQAEIDENWRMIVNHAKDEFGLKGEK